jgi:hypothetical protein
VVGGALFIVRRNRILVCREVGAVGNVANQRQIWMPLLCICPEPEKFVGMNQRRNRNSFKPHHAEHIVGGKTLLMMIQY